MSDLQENLHSSSETMEPASIAISNISTVPTGPSGSLIASNTKATPTPDVERIGQLPVDTFQYTESEMGQIVDVLEHPVRPPDVPASIATVLSSFLLCVLSLHDFWKAASASPSVLDSWKLLFSLLGFGLCLTIVWRTIAQIRAYGTDPHRRRAIDTAKRMESYKRAVNEQA